MTYFSRMILAAGCIAAVTLTSACTESNRNTDDTEGSLTKEEARALAGKGDMTDYCEEFDWYDDGICDDFCPMPDGDCETDETDVCGGFAGWTCDDGFFCNYELGDLCGAADALGTCEPIPEACTLEYAPVCGCDGQTYGNACGANSAGVAVASQGECDTGQPDTCGGFAGLTCDDGEYCHYEPEDICGAADALGTCLPAPEACAAIYDPVCGCDGQTYGNACEANASGVSVASEGECGGNNDGHCGGFAGLECDADEYCHYEREDICGAADQLGTCLPRPEACTLQYAPVCACDGQTYGNECEANLNGVSAVSDGECGSTEPQRCEIADDCSDDEYCDFDSDGACLIFDVYGTCQPRPEECTAEYAPVCGCDGITYSNRCAAAAAGVDVTAEGECGDGGGDFCQVNGDCSDDEMCWYEEPGSCIVFDTPGACVPRPEACTLLLDPVCGCDGQTYSNACFAQMSGASVLHEGECE